MEKIDGMVCIHIHLPKKIITVIVSCSITYFFMMGHLRHIFPPVVVLFHLKGHCIEFKYYADGVHSGLTPPG